MVARATHPPSVWLTISPVEASWMPTSKSGAGKMVPAWRKRSTLGSRVSEPQPIVRHLPSIQAGCGAGIKPPCWKSVGATRSARRNGAPGCGTPSLLGGQRHTGKRLPDESLRACVCMWSTKRCRGRPSFLRRPPCGRRWRRHGSWRRGGSDPWPTAACAPVQQPWSWTAGWCPPPPQPA